MSRHLLPDNYSKTAVIEVYSGRQLLLRFPTAYPSSFSLSLSFSATIEILGSRVSRDSCPQTMLDLSWIFPIKRAEGLDRSGAKEEGVHTEPYIRFSLPLGHRLEKGSHEVLEKSSLHPARYSLFFFFSFFFSFAFPPSIPRYELATLTLAPFREE